MADNPVPGDSPSGEMPVADVAAEVPEYLPPGKKSRTEVKEEEDVQMEAPEEQHEEEPPQEDPMNVTDDAPDYGEEDLNDEYFETESVMLRRANELLNSQVYEHFANEGNIEGEPNVHEQRPRMASPALARFLHNMLESDRNAVDNILQADRERRQRRHEEGIPFVEIEKNEENIRNHTSLKNTANREFPNIWCVCIFCLSDSTPVLIFFLLTLLAC